MNDTDFHETEEFLPTMLALSHFIIQWNWAEHNFNVLLWQFVGDMQTGAMYTAGLGNQSRADALLALARKHEKNPSILEGIEFAVSAFGKIKSNRNSLAHAHSIHHYPGDEKPSWIRASSNPKNIHVFCYADEKDVEENLVAASKLSQYLLKLTMHYIGNSAPRPLAEKFQVPKVLLPIPVQHEESESPSQS